MLRATGTRDGRQVDLILSSETSTLWFRTEEDLWDKESFASAAACSRAAEERFGVSAGDWAPGDMTPADTMQAYAVDAVLMARDRFGIQLDLSEASVEQVEEILARIYDGRPAGAAWSRERKAYERAVDGHAKMWGGYVGEVLRRHHGGEWNIVLISRRPAACLKWSEKRMLFPADKVYQRLTNGPGDSVAVFYRIMVEKL